MVIWFFFFWENAKVNTNFTKKKFTTDVIIIVIGGTSTR